MVFSSKLWKCNKRFTTRIPDGRKNKFLGMIILHKYVSPQSIFLIRNPRPTTKIKNKIK